MGPTLQVSVVSLGVFRRMAGLLGLFLPGQTDREGRNDLRRDLVLQGEE